MTTPPAKSEVPKVAVNAPDGTSVAGGTTASTPSASKVPSPAPSAAGAAKPADAVPAFRNFVSTEKDRLMKKKQALMKSEMDKRLSDLVNFSKSFKLNKPIPEDLVPILAKDEDKQRAIKEKSTRDAEDARARAIGVSSVLTAAPGARPVPTAAKAGAETTRAAVAKPSAAGNAMQKTTTAPSKPGETGKKIAMYIQPIPPFKGKRSTTVAAPAPTQASAPAATAAANGAPKPAASPLSPTAQNRLNVNASSFRPNVKASAFSPVSLSECILLRLWLMPRRVLRPTRTVPRHQPGSSRRTPRHKALLTPSSARGSSRSRPQCTSKTISTRSSITRSSRLPKLVRVPQSRLPQPKFVKC